MPPRMTAPSDRFAHRQGAATTPTATRPTRPVPRPRNRPTRLSFISRPAPDSPPSFADTVLTLHAPPPFAGPAPTAAAPDPSDPAAPPATAIEFDLDRTFFAWDPAPPPGKDPDMTERRGLAPETVTATWLLPDRLLWVRWTTCAEGTGRFIEEGHLLLLASGSDWIELLRDRFGALDRFDDGEFVTTRMSIARQGQALSLSKVHVEEEWSEGKPPVWTTLVRRPWRGGGKRFFASLRTVEEWQYQIDTGTWTCLGGHRFFETGRQALPVEEIATRFGLASDTLRQLNPAQARKTRWRGRIVLAAPLPPYAPATPQER